MQGACWIKGLGLVHPGRGSPGCSPGGLCCRAACGDMHGGQCATAHMQAHAHPEDPLAVALGLDEGGGHGNGDVGQQVAARRSWRGGRVKSERGEVGGRGREGCGSGLVMQQSVGPHVTGMPTQSPPPSPLSNTHNSSNGMHRLKSPAPSPLKSACMGGGQQ